MKLTKILLAVILVLTITLLTIAWFIPSDATDSEDAELLRYAGDISDEEKEVWLEDYKMAVEYFDKGEYVTAIEILDNAIAIDPQNCIAYFQRAKAYELTGADIDADWDYQAAEFLAAGNSIYDFEYVPTYEETEPASKSEVQSDQVATEPQPQYISSENADWKDSDSRLTKVKRYSDGNVTLIYTFQYDDHDRVVGYKEENYWDGDSKVSYTDIWEYTYNESGQILKEFNPSHSNQTTYEYTYVNGEPTRCLMSLEGVGYRTYQIATIDGKVVTIEGKGVYDPDYGFELSYSYDSKGMIPVSARGSETMSKRPSNKIYEYSYYPALMHVAEVSQTEGFRDSENAYFRINDLQLVTLPTLSIPDGGYFGENDDGLITEIYDHENTLVWELSYEAKTSETKRTPSRDRNRRIARINEYNSKGVTETNTFDYDKDGLLAGYTTTYYENGNIAEKDVWTFEYTDDGRVFDERRDWGEEDYYGYVHIFDEEIAGYQVFYGRGVQQQFYYEYDANGRISGITGVGVHDYIYESDIEYVRDKNGNVTQCSGTLSSTENAEYQINKKYDYSYSGVVLVEDSSLMNGTALPVTYYLRVDMPEYIGLPEVVYYAGDEIITDEEGYIVKILDKSGALRCELIFDYC